MGKEVSTVTVSIVRLAELGSASLTRDREVLGYVEGTVFTCCFNT